MLEVDGLSKRFARHTVVDDLTFSLDTGEVLGFLGPNGAGKSTSMKMIAGFLRPDAGTARISGRDIITEALAAKRLLGYLPEGAPAYGDMRVREFLGFVADARALTGQHRRQRLERVIAEVHIGEVLEQRIETLSKGFRRRVGLAQAIVHDPPVLILDEPTDGLDPNQKHEVRKLIAGISSDKIIVISTHILEEVEAVCTRAMIIADGRLLVDGTPQSLAARSRYHGAVTLQLGEPEALRARLAGLSEVDELEIDPERREITLLGRDPAALLARINQLVREHDWRIDGLYQRHGRLDEVFRAITRDSLAEALS